MSSTGTRTAQCNHCGITRYVHHVRVDRGLCKDCVLVVTLLGELDLWIKEAA